MEKKQQKRPEKSPDWISKSSTALKENLKRRKAANTQSVKDISVTGDLSKILDNTEI